MLPNQKIRNQEGLRIIAAACSVVNKTTSRAITAHHGPFHGLLSAKQATNTSAEKRVKLQRQPASQPPDTRAPRTFVVAARNACFPVDLVLALYPYSRQST
jgi:hypothetical protein